MLFLMRYCLVYRDVSTVYTHIYSLEIYKCIFTRSLYAYLLDYGFNPSKQPESYSPSFCALNLTKKTNREEAAVTYLGTVLSSNPKPHFDRRIKSATQAFCGLQCAGLCAGGVAPTISTHNFYL